MNTLSRRALIAGFVLFLSMTVSAAAPYDGRLDSAWSDDGKTYIPFDLGGAGNNLDSGYSGVVDQRGAYYIGGLVLDHGVGRIGVAKLDPLGEPDIQFSGDGENTSAMSGIIGNVSVALLPGVPVRLIVATTRQVSASDTDIVVCAFHADLGINLAFIAPNNPVSGCTTAPLTAGVQRAADVVVQPDGRFVVAGTHAAAGSPNERFAYFARFNPDGSVDNSFDMEPKRNVALHSGHEVRAIQRASNGKFVAVGSSTSQFASGRGGLVMRLHADGTLDATGVGGETVFGVDPGADLDTDFNALVLEADPATGEDAIVVAGSAEMTEGKTSGLIARITGANSVALDTKNFGTSAGFSVASPGDNLAFRSIANHPCAGYLVVGNYPVIDSMDMLVFAYSRDGDINSKFGTGGATPLDFFASDQIENGSDVVVSGDGVYIAGATQTPFGDLDFAAAKLFMDSIFCNGFQR